MKAVILAGGFGTRISEESAVKPKPMVNVGDRPILWHIMKIYSAFGINDFVICCGYKGHVIKQYFADYHLSTSDVTFNLKENSMEIHASSAEPWRITCVDTGETTMTGGRLRRVRSHLADETFLMTYGDGVADVDLKALIQFHRQEGKKATLTAVQPGGRFGVFTLEGDQKQIGSFAEKPRDDGAWINGGYFVLEPEVMDYIDGDDTVWERGPMERLARESELSAFRHDGFWQPMDTLRDRMVLEEHWATGKAPWKKYW